MMPPERSLHHPVRESIQRQCRVRLSHQVRLLLERCPVMLPNAETPAAILEDMARLRTEFLQQGMTTGQAAKAAHMLVGLVATLKRLTADTARHAR
ncbi:hypothetical protein [Falsiroseomonas sp. E2-1-a20]|uniref:hypothetical protein n=1 Tax=Falsiroseomonas sp. E2-1-a20 TaxID=3239300 RepID=UPI003F417F27